MLGLGVGTRHLGSWVGENLGFRVLGLRVLGLRVRVLGLRVLGKTTTPQRKLMASRSPTAIRLGCKAYLQIEPTIVPLK